MARRPFPGTRPPSGQALVEYLAVLAALMLALWLFLWTDNGLGTALKGMFGAYGFLLSLP